MVSNSISNSNFSLYDIYSKRGVNDSSSQIKEDIGLNEEEQKKVDELKKRDQEVRTHEQAHIAAGGQYVNGGASFTYQSGPDGRKYAVGGEVSIDTSPISGDPQATIAKMQTVRKAALAPASPSAQDRVVAGKAAQEEAKARSELTKEKTEETSKAETSDPIEKSSKKPSAYSYNKNARAVPAQNGKSYDIVDLIA